MRANAGHEKNRFNKERQNDKISQIRVTPSAILT
jgi:hypothetical protein